MKLRFVSYPMLLLVILAGLLAFQPLSLVLAAAGDLDPDFGTDGKVISDWYDYYFTSAIQAVAVQPDGKIIVAGVSMDWGYFFQTCQMARYNTDGSMDTVHGTVFEGDNAVCSGVAVQSDGKIVVAGWALMPFELGGDTVFAVARYNTDGYSLDTTFNATGIVTTSIGNGSGRAIAIQPDGKIVVVGSSRNGSKSDFAVVRYNVDGSLDTTFNATGIVTTSIGISGSGQAVAIQPDGKIVVVGSSYNGSNSDFAVVRYNTDGSLDAAFDSDGKVTTDFSSDMDGGKSVVIQSDRKIVVAGDVVTDGYHHYGVVRYNTDGSLDTAFGSDGKVTFDFNGNSGYASSVALQSDGKILIAGTSSSSTYDQFSIARLDSNGGMDSGFGSGGQVTTDFGSGSYAYGNVIQTDGKYVVGGSTDSDSYSSAALARYQTGSNTVSGQSGVGADGKAIIGSTNVMAKYNTGSVCTGGVVTVTKTLDYPGGSSDLGEMPMYWNISNDCGASAYAMDLTLCYTDDELADGNSVTEANLRLYRWNGSTWVPQGGTVDTALNCVTLTGVTSLSSWTLGDPTAGSPTAATLQDLTAQPGRFASGSALIGLSALVITAFGVARSRCFDGTSYPRSLTRQNLGRSGDRN